MTIFFAIAFAYFAVTSVLVWRRRAAGPRLAVRLAILLAIGMMAFPWLRSVLSRDGRGLFSFNAVAMSWEWALILMALGPVHAVSVFAVLGKRA